MRIPGNSRFYDAFIYTTNDNHILKPGSKESTFLSLV